MKPSPSTATEAKRKGIQEKLFFKVQIGSDISGDGLPGTTRTLNQTDSRTIQNTRISLACQH